MSNTKMFGIGSNKRSCCVDLHRVIAMRYTALYQITAIFQPNKNVWFCWQDGGEDLKAK